MDTLSKIVAFKKKEVEGRRNRQPVKVLEWSAFFERQTLSLKQHVTHPDKSGIIAEFKRKSPSKGMINPHVPIERTSTGYIQAGASALSILTDSEFFGGSNEDLIIARKLNSCPILRKEFIIDEYQIIESKSIGADAILLIVAILDEKELVNLTHLAQSLGMEVLIEVHNEVELSRALNARPDLVGVNNRNLKTFEVSLDTCRKLAPMIDTSVTRVAESGIDAPETILKLRQHGFEGFLIGEHFMRHSQPEVAASMFIKELNRIRNEPRLYE